MFEVLHIHPQFRRLWFAQVVSQLGDWFNRIAILALIGQLGGHDAALGVGGLYAFELAVRLLPVGLFGPIAGPFADRVSRKGMMIATDLIRGAVVLAMILVREPEHLPWLYTLLVAQMSMAMFFESARAAALPGTVEQKHLHTAFALSAATWSLMLTIGTLASAATIHTLGIRGLFIADALTYVLSALILIRLKLPPMPKQTEAFRWADILSMKDLRRGWTHLREANALAGVTVKAFWGPAGGFLVLISIVARDRFALAETGALENAAELAKQTGSATAFLLMGRGIGTGLGPILTRRFFGSTDRALLGVTFASFIVASIGYSFFAISQTLWLATLCVLVGHLGGGSIWVSSTTFWQRHVSDAFRGRVKALETLGMAVSFSLGGWTAGWLYDRTGSIQQTVWAQVAAVLVGGLAWRWLHRSRFRSARVDFDRADFGAAAFAKTASPPKI